LRKQGGETQGKTQGEGGAPREIRCGGGGEEGGEKNVGEP